MSRTNSITSSATLTAAATSAAAKPTHKIEKPRTLKENFKQQTLPAWRPTFTANKVSPLLFLIGILFIPLGVGIMIYSDNIDEIRVVYTDCLNTLRSIDNESEFNKSCSEVIDSPETALVKDCRCRIRFNIPKKLDGTVYVYYALTQFYQNHRKYVSSRDDKQLRDPGTVEKPRTPSSECAPYDYYKEPSSDGSEEEDDDDEAATDRVYYPCGAIANSMFSDEIRLFYNETGSTEPVPVPLNRTGIAWESDRKWKFEYPEWFANMSKDPGLQHRYVKPKFWKKNLWELDPENPDNNGVQNEDFIVWMRTAALPDFRKLYRIVNNFDTKRREFVDGLPEGDYIAEIDYNFAVKSFEGTKTIILSTTSVLGAPNRFLGITYIIVGSVCVILGLFTLIVHIAAKKKMNPKSASNETQGLLSQLRKEEGLGKDPNYYGT